MVESFKQKTLIDLAKILEPAFEDGRIRGRVGVRGIAKAGWLSLTIIIPQADGYSLITAATRVQPARMVEKNING